MSNNSGALPHPDAQAGSIEFTLTTPTADLVPLGSNTDLVHRRRICPKPVGDDAARRPVFLHDPLEKLQRRDFVPPRGDHSLQDLALMVDGAPQIAELAVDLHKQASGAGEFHPRALSEPDVTLSRHPAPIVRPRPWIRLQ